MHKTQPRNKNKYLYQIEKIVLGMKNLLEEAEDCINPIVLTSPLTELLNIVLKEKDIDSRYFESTSLPIPQTKVLMPYFRSKFEGLITSSADCPEVIKYKMFGFPAGASLNAFN